MHASKVTITQETREKLDNPMLDAQKKTHLKRELVKEYIRSRPSGAKITRKHLMAVAGYDPEKHLMAGYSFIQLMIKNKEIVCTRAPGIPGSVYSVPEDAKLIKAPKAELKAPPAPKMDYKVESIKGVESMAIKFAWEKNSDSLRAVRV